MKKMPKKRMTLKEKSLIMLWKVLKQKKWVWMDITFWQFWLKSVDECIIFIQNNHIGISFFHAFILWNNVKICHWLKWWPQSEENNQFKTNNEIYDVLNKFVIKPAATQPEEPNPDENSEWPQSEENNHLQNHHHKHWQTTAHHWKLIFLINFVGFLL